MGSGTPEDPEGEHPCTLLTSIAEATHEDQRELRLHPYCWRHLYLDFPERDEGPTPEEVELLNFCVRNAVIGHYGGKGGAEVLGPCPIDSVPAPYEPVTLDSYAEDDTKGREFFLREGQPDEAYYATYRDEQGQEKHVAAVCYWWWYFWEIFEFAAPTSS